MPKSRRRASKQSKPRKRPAAQEEGWYTIRRILDERAPNGHVEYLVDWDDNVVTGEAYTPTWSREVTVVAIEEWEARRAERANHHRQSHTVSVEDSDHSQPPRPASWRQLSPANTSSLTQRRSASSSSSPPARPCKNARTDSGGALSEEPVPSFISTPSVDTASEFPDPSDEEDAANHQRATSSVVGITKDPHFNPSDYLSVINSQASGHSSQSLAELESEDSRVAVLTPFCQKTIPDSQENSDQSWTQHQVAERQASPVATVEKELQLSQPSPSPTSCAIPDSLEQPQNTASQSPAAQANPQQNPSSLCLDSPVQVQEDIAQKSEAVGSDIPSRQPDQPTTTVDAEGSELLEPVLHEPSAASSVPESLVSPQRIAPTQPPVSTVFSVPESSVDSQLLGSLCRTAVDAAPARNGPSDPPLDQRESQAAQIVRQDFILVDQQLIDSGPKGASSELQCCGSGQATVSKQLTSQSKTSVACSIPSALEGVFGPRLPSPGPLSSPKPKDQGSSSRNRIMDGASTGGSGPSRPLTVAEELAEIFNLEYPLTDPAPLPLDNRAQPDSLATSSGNATRTQSQRKPSVTQAGLPMNSSELNLDNEPLDAASKPWAQDLVGMSRGTEDEASVPASTSSHGRNSVAEELHDIFNEVLAVGGFGPLDPLPDRSLELQQETVSLADITRQAESVFKDIPFMSSAASQDPVSSKLYESSVDAIHTGQDQSERGVDKSSSTTQQELDLMEHVITLPFQANLRPLYDDIIMEYRGDIKEFGRIFSSEQYSEPDRSLVDKIDDLFNRLLNLCDYPQDVVGTVLEGLSPVEQARYCRDANPKFSFIFELLRGLQHEAEILIIARSPSLLRLLCHLAEELELQFTCDAIGRSNILPAGSDARVNLALPTDKVNPSEFDVVIAFDHSFNDSPIAQRLSKSLSNKQQVLLALVTTHSIEHIDIHVPDDLPLMERKNVLLSAVVRARKLVTDPDRGYREPHEVACAFADFLNGQVEAVLWEEASVPEDVLDVYINSQSQSQMPIKLQEQESGRKRKRDGSDDSDAKRMRVLSTKEAGASSYLPPLPDEVRVLLQSAAPKERPSLPEVLVQVPLSVLGALAEKFSEYKRQVEAVDHDSAYRDIISGLEKRTKEYERTAEKVYKSQRVALSDRSRIEAEKRKVEASFRVASELAEKEAEKAQKRILELESAVARLTKDDNASSPQDTPLAKTEKLFQEAQTKVSILEKRLQNAQEDEEYVRKIYQDASTTASAMKVENKRLKAQNDDLSKKSSDSFARVHELQERSTVKIYMGQITELKAQVKGMEFELDHARDELRQLKNGRRETRQASVPRSPRMSMMSPRTTRGYGGSASRGTSPAAGVGIDGVQFLGQQSCNSRWNHLQD